jgi:hypothetical protein
MRDLYFNHSIFVGANANVEEFKTCLKEIASLSACAREEGASIRFYEQIWKTKLGNKQELREFLFEMPKTTEDLKLIMGYVNQGPHYSDQTLVAGLTIAPDVSRGTFAEKLLHICFTDKHEGIVSPAPEPVLKSPSYSLSKGSELVDAWNAIGKEALLDKLRLLNPFRSIQDVFDDINGRHLQQLFILESAKKSARRHNFLNRFPEVHTALLALVALELHNIVDNIDEAERIERFRQATGLEISKESAETMKDDYYRNERLFTIPGQQHSELFEWHVKIGNYIRIHYFVDKSERIIYIGHCGKHLPVKNFKT